MGKNSTRAIFMVSAVILLAILIGSLTQSVQKQSDDASGFSHRSAADPLFARGLDACLSILEDPDHRSAEFIDLRIETQNSLNRHIESAGGSLIQRATDVVIQWPGDTELRKRAMLILAQVPLRDGQKDLLHRSRIPEVGAYHHILCEGPKDVLQTIRSVQPDDVNGDASDIKEIPHEILVELSRQLAPILLHEDSRRAGDDTRWDSRVCDHVSHKFLLVFDPTEPFWAGEIALVANDDWNLQSDSQAIDVPFVAVFQKAVGHDRYVLQSYERLDERERIVDILVGDLNRDGTDAEFAVRTQILGLSSGMGVLRAYEGWGPILPEKLFSFEPSYLVSVFESEDRVFFVTSRIYLDSFVGAAMRAVGALGFEETLWRWDGVLQPAAVLYTPLDWK